MMSTLPKALSLVRGLRDTVPPPPPQNCRGSSAPGRMTLLGGLCLRDPLAEGKTWGWSGLVILAWTGLPGSQLSSEGRHPPTPQLQSEQLLSAPVFAESFIWQELYLLGHLNTMNVDPQHLLLHPAHGGVPKEVRWYVSSHSQVVEAYQPWDGCCSVCRLSSARELLPTQAGSPETMPQG